jgi:hypothetical protein
MSAGAGLTRVTVNLVPKAAVALKESAALEGISRTDVVNRAVQLYAMFVAETTLGSKVLLRAPDASMREVTFL